MSKLTQIHPSSCSSKLTQAPPLKRSRRRKSKKTNRLFERLEKLPLSLKLFLIVIFAFLSLLAFACVLVYKSVTDMQSSVVITKISSMTTLMANLVHCSQLERAASALYLGSNGTDYLNLVMERRNATDKALNDFMTQRYKLIDELKTSSPLFGQVLKSFDLVDEFINTLPTLRVRVLKLQFVQTIEALNFFSNWNTKMIDTVMLVSSLSSESTFMTIQSAFNTLTAMKEYTGQKRAIGSAALASHSMPFDNFLLFVRTQAKASLLQHYLQLKDVFSIWDIFNNTVLNTKTREYCLTMEAYIVSNYNNLTLYSGLYWHGNMTQHINDMRLVEIYISNLSFSYASELYEDAVGVMVAYIASSVFVTSLSITIAMIFSRSIASPWHKIVELQRLQELYKSFIPAHVLLQIEAENGDEDDYMKIEDDVPKEEDVKSKDPSHTSASNSTLQSSTRYNSNKIDLASKFSLYLEKKKVSMIQVKFQGLEWILDNGTPIEIIEILKDIFEKIQFSTRSTSSLMEHVDDDSVSIVFNASRDQSRHEEKAIKTCMDLSDKLRELQNAKWMHSDKSHSILAANHIVFRFAIHVQHCLCGNVGTADIRSFKILGSIYENISNLTNHASQMHLRIVCDETISKISQSLYHTRFVGFTNFVDEVNTYKSSNVYEIGAPLSVSDDEWLYELANKQKNEEWNDYNMACKAFFATNFGLALLGFEKYEQGHSHDLPTKHMIQLCKKELHQGSYFVASDL